MQTVVAYQTKEHYSYIVGVISFADLAFYAWRVSGILNSQGIYFNKKIAREYYI
jgi:MFS transporter, FHS family, L-fucose permease